MKLNRLLPLLWIAVLVLALPAGGWAQAQHQAGAKPATARATFAGGCFWCMEEVYEKVPGVIAAVSGYMGGHVKNPTYEQVSTAGTGHAEVVQVEYDPSKVTYARLLEVFWRNIDPTQRTRSSAITARSTAAGSSSITTSRSGLRRRPAQRS